MPICIQDEINKIKLNLISLIDLAGKLEVEYGAEVDSIYFNNNVYL
jgi:hypothetical protein